MTNRNVAMRLTLMALCFTVPVMIGFFSAEGQTRIDKCAVPKDLKLKYKLVSEDILLSKDKILLDVAISPKDFNEEFLRKFAKLMKATYCKAQRIGVNLYDDPKLVAGAHHLFIISGGKSDRRRGAYVFDGVEGSEGFDFSTKPGNPLDEVKVDISKP